MVENWWRFSRWDAALTSYGIDRAGPGEYTLKTRRRAPSFSEKGVAMKPLRRRVALGCSGGHMQQSIMSTTLLVNVACIVARVIVDYDRYERHES
jgi:hypothetical protein